MNKWNPYNSELYHYGTKGMRWGDRKYQNIDGTQTEAGKIRRRVGRQSKNYDIQKERPVSSYNLDKWGSTKDTNILWVSGLPGSGKSSIARNMAKENNADLIDIDLYTFKTADKYVDNMSKSFNKYLDKNVPNWKEMQRTAYSVLTKNDRRKQKLAGLWFDTFEEALKGYGSEMYGKKKVIAEGVQILDETLFYNNKKSLKNQPVLMVNTSVEESLLARTKRDNKTIEKLLEPERLQQLNTFVNGKKIVEQILNSR